MSEIRRNRLELPDDIDEETKRYYLQMGAKAMIDIESDPTDVDAQQRRKYALQRLGMLPLEIQEP